VEITNALLKEYLLRLFFFLVKKSEIYMRFDVSMHIVILLTLVWEHKTWQCGVEIYSPGC